MKTHTVSKPGFEDDVFLRDFLGGADERRERRWGGDRGRGERGKA